MGFAFDDFVSCWSHPELHSRIEALPKLSTEAHTCFLTGVPKSGKTSLLMHFALKEAAAGRHSAFICQRQKIENDPPVLPDGIDPEDDLLNQIHMKYVSRVDDILEFSVHGRFLLEDIHCIFVDDLSQLVEPSEGRARMDRQKQIRKMVAYLYELCQTLREKGQHSRLVVTGIGLQEGPMEAHLYDRWLHVTLCLSGHAPSFKLFQFENGQSGKQLFNRAVHLLFSCDVYKATAIESVHVREIWMKDRLHYMCPITIAHKTLGEGPVLYDSPEWLELTDYVIIPIYRSNHEAMYPIRPSQ